MRQMAEFTTWESFYPGIGESWFWLQDWPEIHYFRLTVWTYESVLRNECNYTGAQPYWDYTLDSPEKGGHFNSSPIFDPVYGFGGGGKGSPSSVPTPPRPVAPPPVAANSSTSAAKGAPPKGQPKGAGGMSGMCGFGGVCGSCVTDGPFAKYKVYIGPGNSTKSNPRCLVRNLNAQAAEAGSSPSAIERLMSREKYEQFQTLDTSPDGFTWKSTGKFTPGIHSVGHMGVGGDVSLSNGPQLLLEKLIVPR
jgi:tyrosinase